MLSFYIGHFFFNISIHDCCKDLSIYFMFLSWFSLFFDKQVFNCCCSLAFVLTLYFRMKEKVIK